MESTYTLETLNKSPLDAISKRNILRIKWVFKINANEISILFKSRFVTLSFKQDVSHFSQKLATALIIIQLFIL